MIKLALEPIKKFVNGKDFPFESQPETGQLYAPLQYYGATYHTYLRIFEQADLLQVMTFLPCNIKEGCTSDVARLLHRINKEIDLPGYGMDEDNKVVFYRLMLPATKQQVEGATLHTYLRSLDRLCETFTAPIVAVAQGQLTFQKIVEQLNS